MKNLLVIFVAVFSLTALTQTGSLLDQLIQKVKQEQAQESAIIQERETEFLAAKDRQAQLLQEAKARLAKLEARTQQLTQNFDQNEKELTILEDKLAQATGTLGEMFGVVKQMSNDLTAQLSTSVVSAQYADRDDFVRKLASRKELPTSEELRQLWMEILKETSESGKIVRFEREVINADGSSEVKEITRVGAFNLIAQGQYLNYQAETSQVVVFARQPSSQYTSSAKRLERAKGGDIVEFGLDPSRGSLLGLLVNAPDLTERVNQGGVVGYIILCLLFIGLVISVERFLFLKKQKQQIHQQLVSSEADLSNPLGRLMSVYEKYAESEKETLELKLDEAIVKEVPAFEKGISTIKILAAIGPLMGLLGTVTGMIMTFQTITLFGTGDPKLMAGGISSALMTTVLGLVCAIPMLLLHNYLATKAKSLVQLLEEQSIGLLSLKVGEAKQGK